MKRELKAARRPPPLWSAPPPESHEERIESRLSVKGLQRSRSLESHEERIERRVTATLSELTFICLNLMKRELKVGRRGPGLRGRRRGNLMKRELKDLRGRGERELRSGQESHEERIESRIGGPTPRERMLIESHEERIESVLLNGYSCLYISESHEERIESSIRTAVCLGSRGFESHEERIESGLGA